MFVPGFFLCRWWPLRRVGAFDQRIPTGCVQLILGVCDLSPTWAVALRNKNAEVSVWRLLQQTVERLLQYCYSNVSSGYCNSLLRNKYSTTCGWCLCGMWCVVCVVCVCVCGV